MTTIFILAIIGVGLTWLGVLFGGSNRINLMLHVILAVVAWPINLPLAIISIGLAGFGFFLNLAIMTND